MSNIIPRMRRKGLTEAFVNVYPGEYKTNYGEPWSDRWYAEQRLHRRKGRPSSYRLRVKLKTHDLYKTGDAGAPEAIKDRNGEVVLGLCKTCGRAEIELSEPCNPRLDKS